jgi:hypothetical protein
MSELSYRLVEESDFPIIIEMYTLLNTYFYQMGYRLPHPENVGDIWLDSFRRTLGRFSNVFIAEVEALCYAVSNASRLTWEVCLWGS